jgi:hypothetical protein
MGKPQESSKAAVAEQQQQQQHTITLTLTILLALTVVVGLRYATNMPSPSHRTLVFLVHLRP